MRFPRQLLVILGVALFLTVGALSQQSSSNTLPLAVDGAQAPDRISDVTAYRHFIMAAAQRRSPAAGEIGLRDAVMARIGLSSDDKTRFVGTLAGVREQLETIERAESVLSTDTEAGRSALLAQRANREQLLDATRAVLRTSLSADGANRLNAFVKGHVKAHIKVYGAVQ